MVSVEGYDMSVVLSRTECIIRNIMNIRQAWMMKIQRVSKAVKTVSDEEDSESGESSQRNE